MKFIPQTWYNNLVFFIDNIQINKWRKSIDRSSWTNTNIIRNISSQTVDLTKENFEIINSEFNSLSIKKATTKTTATATATETATIRERE